MQPPTSERPIAPKRPGLLPSLSFFTATTLVIGGVIGSGIFRKPGVMAAQVGSPQLLLGVWLVAGVITLFGALATAEVASMIPETGGQYVYYERMYGPFVAFLYGWAVFAVIQTGSIAAVCYVFAEYATEFVRLPELRGPLGDFAIHLPFIGDIAPFREIGVKGLAAALVLGLTLVNYFGVKFGGLVQDIFTLAKMAAMVALVAVAFLAPGVGHAANLVTPSATIHPGGLALAAAIAAALQGAFWAYDGWAKITFIAGEVREPQRNVPRSLFVGMTIVTVIYLLMNLAYAYVLPIDAIARSKLVAADVAERAFEGGGRWIAVAVMISTAGCGNAMILASARVHFAMAERGSFPRFMAAVHPRFHTPGASLWVQGLWSTLLLFSGTFDILTDTLIFVSWIFYAAITYGVFVLRRKEPDTPRPYKVPGYPVVPWVFIAFALLFLVFTIYNDLATYRAAIAEGRPALLNFAFGLFLLLLGTPIYFLFGKGRGIGRKDGRLAKEKS